MTGAERMCGGRRGVRLMPVRTLAPLPDRQCARAARAAVGQGQLRPMFAFMDSLRKAQGTVLEGFGFGPTECDYHLLASGPRWRLRDYGGPDAGPLLLIVAAPIKRP